MFADANKIKELCAQDFNLFSALVLGDHFRYDFPDLYIELFELIKTSATQERNFDKFAFGIPRGFAKTTWAKLLVTWLILHTDKKFIGIAGTNIALAENIIADIWEFLTCPNIKNVYGDITATTIENTKEKKVFKYNLRTVALVGVGANGNPRGWNIANNRPDFLLMDDIQSRACAESDIETKALHRWIFSTFLYTASPYGCTTLFLGNMYPGKNSILQMLTANPAWTSIVVGGILASGESLWEELYPIAQLKQAYQEAVASGTEAYFAAEILNDNEAQVSFDFTSRDFAPLPYQDTEPILSKYIVIDPSGRKRSSNKTVIAQFDVWEGTPVLTHIITGIFDPQQTIVKAIELAIETQTATICIEDVNYQETLIFWFEKTLQQLKIEGIILQPINPRGQSKTTRIREAVLAIKSGKTLIHPRCRAQVFNEIRNWRPTKTNNEDDILDVVAYGGQVLISLGETLPILLDASDTPKSVDLPTFNSMLPLYA